MATKALVGTYESARMGSTGNRAVKRLRDHTRHVSGLADGRSRRKVLMRRRQFLEHLAFFVIAERLPDILLRQRLLRFVV